MTSRSVLGRPRRTKVYDCNFTAGERYYRPVVDSLDRRPGASSASPDSASFPSLRATLAADEPTLSRPQRRPTPRLDDDFDVEEPRRRANVGLLDEYDSIFENRGRALRGERSERSQRSQRDLQELEDEADKEISAYLKRVRQNRPARPTLEDEFELDVTPKGSKRRPFLDFQEKLLDTVGLKNSDVEKARTAMEEEASFKRRSRRVAAAVEDEEEEAPAYTKWTAVSRRGQVNGEDAESGAAARARKTRNRLADLNSEIEELADRSAAREKRVAQLRQLVQENEANAVVEARSVQKMTVRSEKKTVTF